MDYFECDKKRKVVKVLLACALAIFSAISFFLISPPLYLLKGKGDYLYSVVSPDQGYRASLYVISGGSLSSDMIRVGIDSTRDKRFDDRTIYLYYPYDDLPSNKFNIETVRIDWLSEQEVAISNNVMTKVINIHDRKDYYNWRKELRLPKKTVRDH
mgnify:FL=1